MAPAGTPEPALKALEAGIAEILRDPALRAALVSQGWDLIGIGAREFAAFLDQELPKLGAAAKAAEVKAD
jgi:tripartite-type tricarboxylate transporter receptor subunit TctC